MPAIPETENRALYPKWGFPKIRGTFLGVPIIRTVVFWVLYWAPLVLGNYQTGFQGAETFLELENQMDKQMEDEMESGGSRNTWGDRMRLLIKHCTHPGDVQYWAPVCAIVRSMKYS